MTIRVARFLDVADGLQPGQFTVGGHASISSLSELDPVYRRLLDEPVTAIVSVTAGDGRSNLTPVWFDYEGDVVLLNLASHRRKVAWLRKNPQVTFALMNPQNAYHWISVKCTVSGELSEDDPVHARASPPSWTASGPSTPATSRPTGCATRPSTSAGSCSNSPSTASRPSGSPDG